MFATFALLLAAPALAQDSSRDDFEQLWKDFRGRWVGDIVLTADMPGFGKQGERILCYSQNTRANHRNTITIRNQIGADTGTWVIAYDAGTKQIRSLYSTSAGVFNQSVLRKTEGGWLVESTGCSADGKKCETRLSISLANGGSTHTLSGTTTIDGNEEELPDSVWKRISDQ